MQIHVINLFVFISSSEQVHSTLCIYHSPFLLNNLVFSKYVFLRNSRKIIMLEMMQYCFLIHSSSSDFASFPTNVQDPFNCHVQLVFHLECHETTS